ncbi:velvet factor-domain-containing protein [Mycena latifolia]|nr:velvet factor-domain-containing protein [Mycena latifolia]
MKEKTKFIHPERVKNNPDHLLQCLVIRQMPVQARTSGNRNKDKRIFDPTPVVELCFYEVESQRRVRVPRYQLNGYTLFAKLVTADTHVEVAFASDGETSSLFGSAISTLFAASDPETEPPQPSVFFVFHDLGVRPAGTFRLHFTLSIPSPRENNHQSRMTVLSEPFQVVSGSLYNGVKPATPLTRTLARFGTCVRVRNMIRETKARSPKGSAPSGPRRRKPRTPVVAIHAPIPRYPPRAPPLLLRPPSRPPSYDPCLELERILAVAAEQDSSLPVAEKSFDFLANCFSSDLIVTVPFAA